MDFQNIWSVFRASIFEFVLEIFVFYFIFQLGMKKRKLFYVYFINAFFLTCLLGFGLTFFYVGYGNTIWGRSIVYTSMFLVSYLLLIPCFDESLWSVLFCAIGAYAAQNLAYQVYLIVWYIGEAFNVFPQIFQREYASFFFYLYYYSFFSVEVLAVYFLFARKMRDYLSLYSVKFKVLVFSVFVILITVVLTTIQDIYISVEPTVLRISGNLLAATCCVCILLLLSGFLEKKESQAEIELLQRMMKEKQQQLEISKESIDLVNIKCHDMRHRLQAMKEQGEEVNAENFKDLEESVSLYDTNAQTGNKALDVIITEKQLFCRKHGIRLSFIADGKELSFMEDNDVYCLFGNILENALEAVGKVIDTEKKTICLTIKKTGQLLSIHEENYFEGKIRFEKGMPLTSKKDDRYHGFGMKSIEYIVRKYKGEVTSNAEKSIFHLNIMFSVPDTRPKKASL